MAEEKKEVALTFSEYMTVELNNVNEALPKDFNKARFVQNAIAVINDTPGLQKMGAEKLKAGLLKGAFLGLDFFNKEAHLIPYGNTLQFIPDFRGSRKLVKKYSIKPVDDVDAFLIREGDEFKLTNIGGVQSFIFNPIPLNNGKIIGAFAYVLFADGKVKMQEMNLKELEATRNQSKAKNSPAWQNFTGEMYKKTVLHRLCKGIDLEFESPQQRDLFMAGNEIDTQQKPTKVDNPWEDDSVIDADYEVVEETEVVEDEDK